MDPLVGQDDHRINLKKDLSELSDVLKEALSPRPHTVQTTNINAGGWGIIISLIMVAFLAGLNISQSIKQVSMSSDINEIRRKQERDDDYVTSIFKNFPDLKKKAEEDRSIRIDDSYYNNVDEKRESP